MLYSHLHIYMFMQHHNDTIIKTHDKDAGRKTQEDFFRKIFTSHFIARVRKGCSRVACERELETEHKLHILTPLLWPSRCVFLVLPMLGSTPSGVSEGPLGRVWLSLPHLVSNSLGVCWQLHLISIFSGSQTPSGGFEGPLGRVWLSLPHLVSSCWQLLGPPNSTELNNNSTPTRSPTGSLKSNV